MRPSSLLQTRLLAAFLLTACAPMTNPTPAPHEDRSFRIVAYATQAMPVENIPYGELTHLNYSFLIPNADGTCAPLENARKLETIVEDGHRYNVQVSLAVGGWGWDNEFEQMASRPESRAAFIRNLKDLVDQYRLDGLDIDWEYPDPGDSAQNYLALMKELRSALPHAWLSTAVISQGDEMGQGIPDEAFALVDTLNVMAYDGENHGSLQEFEEALAYWTARGVPRGKINIGVPFYSRPGEVPFATLVALDPAAAGTDTFDYHGQTQYYNGIPSLQNKTRIAMQRAGGLMFWALDHDAPGQFSLVDAIYQTVHAP